MNRNRPSFSELKAAHGRQRSPVDLGAMVELPQSRKRLIWPLFAAAAMVAGAVTLWMLADNGNAPDPVDGGLAARDAVMPDTGTTLPEIEPPVVIVKLDAPPRRRPMPPRLPSIRQANVHIPARPPIVRRPSLATLPGGELSY